MTIYLLVGLKLGDPKKREKKECNKHNHAHAYIVHQIANLLVLELIAGGP